eukprot:jgi/Mesvir1/17214/Mv07628-RA.1
MVKHFAAHSATVNELSFDAEGEYIASCSDDGTVAVHSLYTDEVISCEYHRPIKTVSLEPGYVGSKSREFVAGGLAGQLLLNSQGWMGRRNRVLHAGEGPVHATKWHGRFITWANDAGVKIYDAVASQRLAYIDRPRGSPRADLYKPHIEWDGDMTVIIGWADCVKVAVVRPRSHHAHGYENGSEAAATVTSGAIPFVGLSAPVSRSFYVEVVAIFQTEYFIAGIAPYGDLLLILAYVPPQSQNDANAAGDGEKAHDVHAAGATHGASRQQALTMNRLSRRMQNAERPEIRLVTRENKELALDALTIHGYEHFQANDYRLVCAPPVEVGNHSKPPREGKGGAGRHQICKFPAGEEPLYYIASPKDLVVAKPRDADDHIAWLLEHKKFEQALEAAEDCDMSAGLQEATLQEVGRQYVEYLLAAKRYEEAARLCPKLLRGVASTWERFVFHFAHLRQLPCLAPHIPTSKPVLRDTAYEVVLNAFLSRTEDHPRFLQLVRTWPTHIYGVANVLAAATQRLSALNTASQGPLKEALGELYVHSGQMDKALAINLELRKTDVFDFVIKHNLFAAASSKAVALMDMGLERAVSLMVEHRGKIKAAVVVHQLQAGIQAATREDKPDEVARLRNYLYMYLHALFDKAPASCTEFHSLLLELYADFNQPMLLTLLSTSQHYSLDKALEICRARKLANATVFVLGRVGNGREALALIMDELQDVEQAIQFVTGQQDDELWEELISRSLANPQLVGMLLEHIGAHVDPLQVLRQVPLGMPIPRLRDRLVRIVSDYRTAMSLRHGCNAILKSDCADLSERHLVEARHGIHVAYDSTTPGGGDSTHARAGPTGTSSAMPQPGEIGFSQDQSRGPPGMDNWGVLDPSSRSGTRGGDSSTSSKGVHRGSANSGIIGGGHYANGRGPAASLSSHLWLVPTSSGRCSLCFEFVGLHEDAAAIFYCAHTYHMGCLASSAAIEGGGASRSPHGADAIATVGSRVDRTAAGTASMTAPGATAFMGEANGGTSRRFREGGDDGAGMEEGSVSVDASRKWLRCILCTSAQAVAADGSQLSKHRGEAASTAQLEPAGKKKLQVV